MSKEEPDYTYAGEAPLLERIKQVIPNQLVPTKKFAGALGTIFLIIVIIAVVQFPLAKLMSGDPEITINVGYPYHFLELKLLDPTSPPLILSNLIIDLLIYISLSYMIDVTINYFLSMSFLKSKDEKCGIPKVYKDLEPETAEKIKSSNI